MEIWRYKTMACRSLSKANSIAGVNEKNHFLVYQLKVRQFNMASNKFLPVPYQA